MESAWNGRSIFSFFLVFFFLKVFCVFFVFLKISLGFLSFLHLQGAYEA